VAGIGLVAYTGADRLASVSTVPFLMKAILLLAAGTAVVGLVFGPKGHAVERPDSI
jgi:hypothetical protein